MKVITYNLHKGRTRAGRHMLLEATQALAAREPDLLLCQEVYHGDHESTHQARLLSEAMGHVHEFGPNAFYRTGCHGNATFSRANAVRAVNVNISESLFERRGMLCTWFETGDGPLLVLNVHFSLTGRQRRRQWYMLLQALPGDLSVPVLAAGDFNDWSGSLDRRVQRAGILRNALWDVPRYERPTYPAGRPVFALDRFYYRGLRLASVQVLTGLPWSRLSDHLPVEAVFERNGP